MLKSYHGVSHRQRGVLAVEFAIISMLLFTLLFGILEFGRLFYVFNTVQEVTRRAAREAVVIDIDDTDANPAKSLAVFGGSSLPAGAEVFPANIKIEYLTESLDPIESEDLPNTAAENISTCLSKSANCISFVRVSIIGTTGSHCDKDESRACYKPMVRLFPSLEVPIPASTVIMPAESLGYRGIN